MDAQSLENILQKFPERLPIYPWFFLERGQEGEEAVWFTSFAKARQGSAQPRFKFCIQGSWGPLLFCASASRPGGKSGGDVVFLRNQSAPGELSREVCFEGDETATIMSSAPRKNLGAAVRLSSATMGTIKR